MHIATNESSLRHKDSDSDDDDGLIIVDEEEQKKIEVELLREFDLTEKFGPCIGLSRMQRWHRAERFGLEPTPKVRKVLEMLELGDPQQQNLWNHLCIV